MEALMRNYIKNLAFHTKGNYDMISRMIARKARVREYDTPYSYICYGDAEYPEAFKELEKPPYILFYLGNIKLLKDPLVAVIGSRTTCEYSREQTRRLVGHLKHRYGIVSGVAKGIDACAHWEALSHKTIGIIGCGIDVVYPKENTKLYEAIKENHLLLSEYPPGCSPIKHHFPFRNRLIAALSHTIYVMSAQARSGTMTTVNEALTLNRRIVCLPHRIDSQYGIGCNQLIEEGAEILTIPYEL